jgi:hypothetical protein
MAVLVLLLIAFGLAPLAVGAVLLGRPPHRGWPSVSAGSVILCALAFNLTFFWQELWLVLPKALTPGLHPILYHNDHDWTGHAPTVELLQGTGALATLASGLAFSVGLAVGRRIGVTWRSFLFWMAFEGLYQSLTQLAVGSVLPGNDVGRALAYLHVGAASKRALLAIAIAAMALIGVWLARVYASRSGRVQGVAPTAMFAVVLIVPFRVPRDVVEVMLIPLFVNLVGAGWLTLGAAIGPPVEAPEPPGRPGFAGPAVALGVTLLLFQLVLRPGVSFG